MANIGDLNTVFNVSVALMDGATAKREFTTTNTNSVPDNTGGGFERFVIAAGTADTTLSLGNNASVDKLLLVFSEAVDGVYLSTIVGDEKIAMGCEFLYLSGLSSEATIHIDGTSTSADVTVDMLKITDE